MDNFAYGNDGNRIIITVPSPGINATVDLFFINVDCLDGVSTKLTDLISCMNLILCM